MTEPCLWVIECFYQNANEWVLAWEDGEPAVYEENAEVEAIVCLDYLMRISPKDKFRITKYIRESQP